MGCCAAFNALKLADAIVRSQPEARCSSFALSYVPFIFKKREYRRQYVGECIVCGRFRGRACRRDYTKGVQLQLERFYGELAFAGEHDMTWGIGDHGFEMRLSSYVPDIVRTGIRHLESVAPQSVTT